MTYIIEHGELGHVFYVSSEIFLMLVNYNPRGTKYVNTDGWFYRR